LFTLDRSRPQLLSIRRRDNTGRTKVAASLQGELQPTIYRFKLGEFEVATVLDAKAIREGLHPHYGANASADEVMALARANNIDTQRFEHPNIPTLVNTGKQLVLFDTGNGALPREYEQLSKRLPPGQTAARLAAAGRETSTLLSSRMAIRTTSAGWSKAASPCFPMRAMYSARPSSISGSAAKMSAKRASSTANCS
jgi:hypothetical protein